MSHKKILVSLYFLSLVLHACGASLLPTLEAAVPTATGVVAVPTHSTATRFETVMVTGNVNVRDESFRIYGWLAKGELVEAVCSDNWCVILQGQYDGLRFWRGCSSDNPDNLGCMTKVD